MVQLRACFSTDFFQFLGGVNVSSARPLDPLHQARNLWGATYNSIRGATMRNYANVGNTYKF